MIGGVEVSGVPGATLAGEDTSAIYVNLNEGYADYSAAAGAPTGGAWAQVALWDDDGTPFASDALPLEIPTPYDAYFPDDRSFFLRLPGSAEIILSGIVGESPAVVRAGTHTRVRADLDLRADDAGDRHLDLLWGVAGEQAVSFGEFSCPGCEVMGVEPSPFRWRALNLDGEQPAVGEAVLTINLEHPGSEVMGVEPSPFRVFLDLDDGGTGALDFSEATATFPGPLGSLVLEGVRVVLENGTVVDLDGFDIFDATDKVALSGTRFDRFIALAVGDEPGVVGLLASSDDSDLGIAANGWLLCPGCEVMGVEPSPFKWLAVDEDSTPAADGREVAGFSLDPRGEVAGVEPSPFRMSLSLGGAILGELDFGEIGGTFPGALGALSLGDVKLMLPDGSSLGFEVFESFDRNDRLTLVGTRVDLRVIERVTSNERQVDLVVDSNRFGDRGFGSGSITNPGCEVMGVEPSPFRWVVDPETGSPVDGDAAISYLSDLGSTRMGVEPTPFRHLVVGDDGTVLGGLDFSASEGVWGSFHLEGVDVGLGDGSTIEVQSFDTLFVLTVAIDVKPGSDANTINLGSAGVIPVAILSSPSFDATMVDPATISVSGASVKLVGNGKRYLAQPEDVDGDGLDDLMCHVVTDELTLEIGDSVVVLEAGTFDGTAITGQDFIRIVPD